MSNPAPSSSSSPCDIYIQKREACHAKWGDKHEKCCQAALKAKRCLAFEHCPDEAQSYYGETNGGFKDICSAFHESSCFGNPRVMAIDSAKETEDRTRIFKYHEKAKQRIIGGSRKKLRKCNRRSEELHHCMKVNQVHF
jgi:hypothetical protein